jgi:hypothetical protein
MINGIENSRSCNSYSTRLFLTTGHSKDELSHPYEQSSDRRNDLRWSSLYEDYWPRTGGWLARADEDFQRDSKSCQVPTQLYILQGTAHMQWSQGACGRLQGICVRMSGEHENKVL